MHKIMEREKEESQPFLEASHPPCLRCRERPQRWHRVIVIAVAANVLVVFAFAFILRIPGRLECIAQRQTGLDLNSPLEDLVQYRDEYRDEASWQKELYWDHPSPESERAWDVLTNHPRGVFFTPSQSEKFGFEELPGSIGIVDGNFPIILGVFHSLHCLRSIRASYHEDYFFPNMTEKERLERREHNLHCLESLRSSVACNADITAYPFLWKDGVPDSEFILNSAVNRKCVDLAALKRDAGKIPKPARVQQNAGVA